MNAENQPAVAGPVEPSVRPGLIAFLRKIRACENEVAAQLVLEGWTTAVEQREREACRDVVEECIRTQAHLASNAREALSEASARIYKRGRA